VNIRIPEDLRVWAVPVQIQQVLMNLILNAREAMLPRGGILNIKATENSDAVQIEITDTGCGIESDDLRNVFDSFFTTKTDRSSASQHSGSGLGLAFCKKIIDAHGGCISVESQPDQGSTFTITLPKPH
jgi:signal transduction histidine kinase